jgi:hypothetical protein
MKGYSTCYGHRPDLAEERRRNASRGGKRGGRGRPAAELAAAKREIHAVIAGVLTGRVERSVGAVVFQGFNTLLKAIEVERKIKETQDLEERITALEESKGERWGA